MDTLRHSLVKQRLVAIPTIDHHYEITVPREGHVANVIISTTKQARVAVNVGGFVVWSEDVNGVVHLPSINLLKTDYHAVQIVVDSCDINIEDIVADVIYILLEDIVDKRKLGTEGLPNMQGWELPAESVFHLESK